jgi:beta-lactamase regulating signal transducer with metallopeptidase domain
MMLEPTLRAAVILAAAWVVTRVLPRATPATRHLLWHGAIVGSLLVALAALANVPKMAVVPQVPRDLMPPALVRQMPQGMTPLPASGSDRTVGSDTAAEQPSSTPATLATLASLGTALFLLWFLAAWIAAARLARRASPAPAAWQLEAHSLCERLRIQRTVTLGVIDGPSSPLTVGLFRAVILLPQSAGAWSAERRRAVLLHELSHVKRGDCRVQFLAHLACALYWFNPLVWMAAAELRRERERACDDQVLHIGGPASSYAAHLLDIARELRPTFRPCAALAMARPSELEGRLLSVLAARRSRMPCRATRWGVVSVLALITAVAVSATTRPSADPNATAPILDMTAEYIVASDIVMSSQPSPEPRAEAEATLHRSDDADDRELATLALALTSGRDVIPALLQALGDRDPQVREKAAIGLALRRDARVVDPLIAAMSDPDAQVREKVAIALGTSGDPRAHEVLTRALADVDAQVREKAASALVLLGLTR